MTALLVGLGGMLGGSLRYTLGLLVPAPHGFPLATLMINLVGAFFLPLWTQYLGLKLKLPERWILAGGTGFCGAFTTFSSFSLDALKLLQRQQFGAAFSYILISAVGGLGLSLLAVTIAQHQYHTGVHEGDNQLLQDIDKSGVKK
ncbi:fluoride efflux transporter CrcB [Agrilactobacillus fermenti]|uniref:fluoride efflux transporter CrcB n=1 Tax=Agrilactobacillus fermenti TaxID=2586909 RepID=UPI001E3C7969|nr:fluoride efflux transporter CrcB [Agrilactobacillus fermenti]MCD2257091.1 fluoride efflux transporter CrcB [Agrilactobacillus fermenti]